MDLRAENQYKEGSQEDPRNFLPLLEDGFSDLYRYVARRVEDETVRHQVVELVYLDAVGQISTCAQDLNFSTWLYGLAFKRIQEYVKGSVVGPAASLESPVFEGINVMDAVYDDEIQLKQQAETFFSSLTFEEREILRLKFFEELTDGEVMHVLDLSEGSVGTKIYKVLKRGYEILFGEIKDHSGVYYGELHSFLARLKNIEKIPVSDGFRLNLRSKIENKLEKMYLDGFAKEEEGQSSVSLRRLSSDPAKAFVNAAKGLSKDEIDQITEDYVREREVARGSAASTEEAAGREIGGVGREVGDAGREADFSEREVPVEQTMTDRADGGIEEEVPVHHVEEMLDEDYEKSMFAERVVDMFDRWKYVMSLVPTGLFVAAVIVVISIVWFGKSEDEGVTGLPFVIDYREGFEETVVDDFESDPDYELKVGIENDLIAKIVEGQDVHYVDVSRSDGQMLMQIDIDGPGGWQYLFDERSAGGYKVRSFKKL
jgi:DNA-directed RNA polymerase specialized sigma24 family protein